MEHNLAQCWQQPTKYDAFKPELVELIRRHFQPLDQSTMPGRDGKSTIKGTSALKACHVIVWVLSQCPELVAWVQAVSPEAVRLDEGAAYDPKKFMGKNKFMDRNAYLVDLICEATGCEVKSGTGRGTQNQAELKLKLPANGPPTYSTPRPVDYALVTAMGGTSKSTVDAAIAQLETAIGGASAEAAATIRAVVDKAKARTDYPTDEAQQGGKRQRIDEGSESGSPSGASTADATGTASTAMVVWAPEGTMTMERISRLPDGFSTIKFKDKGTLITAQAIFKIMATLPDQEADAVLDILSIRPPEFHTGYLATLCSKVKAIDITMIAGVAKKCAETWTTRKANAKTEMMEVLRVITDARQNADASCAELQQTLDLVREKKQSRMRWEIAYDDLMLQGMGPDAQQLKDAVDAFEDHCIRVGEHEDRRRDDADARRDARPFLALLRQAEPPWDAYFLEQVANVHYNGILSLLGWIDDGADSDDEEATKMCVAAIEGFKELLPTVVRVIARHMCPDYRSGEKRYSDCFGYDAVLRLPSGEELTLTISYETLRQLSDFPKAWDALPVVTPRMYDKAYEMPFNIAPPPPLPVIPEDDTSPFGDFMRACETTAVAMDQRVDTNDASKRAFNEAAKRSRQLMTADAPVPLATLRARFVSFCDDNDLATDGQLGISKQGVDLLKRFGIQPFVKRGGGYGDIGQQCVRGFKSVDFVTAAPSDDEGA